LSVPANTPAPAAQNAAMETFYEVKPAPSGYFRVVRVGRTGRNTQRTEVARYDSEFIADTVARFLNGLAPEEAT
jgi:hypothetical protein